MTENIQQLKPLLPFITFIAKRRNGIETEFTKTETVRVMDLEKSKKYGEVRWMYVDNTHKYKQLVKSSDTALLRELNDRFKKHGKPVWNMELLKEVCKVLEREIADFPPENKPVEAWKENHHYDYGVISPEHDGSKLERLEGLNAATGEPHEKEKRTKRNPKMDNDSLNKFKSLLGHFQRTEHPVIVEYGRSMKVFTDCANAIRFVEEKGLEAFKIHDARLNQVIYVRGNSTNTPELKD